MEYNAQYYKAQLVWKTVERDNGDSYQFMDSLSVSGKVAYNLKIVIPVKPDTIQSASENVAIYDVIDKDGKTYLTINNTEYEIISFQTNGNTLNFTIKDQSVDRQYHFRGV